MRKAKFFTGQEMIAVLTTLPDLPVGFVEASRIVFRVTDITVEEGNILLYSLEEK